MNREEAQLDRFLKRNGGQPIGRLTQRNPDTGLFDAVTSTYCSVQTGAKLAPGTQVTLWNGDVSIV